LFCFIFNVASFFPKFEDIVINSAKIHAMVLLWHFRGREREKVITLHTLQYGVLCYIYIYIYIHIYIYIWCDMFFINIVLISLVCVGILNVSSSVPYIQASLDLSWLPMR